MINREDMLELTRRMTPARTSVTRIAGCYTDRDGEFDGSFNTAFLKLSAAERARHLEIARTVPFSETNVQLKQYRFSEKGRKPGSVWQLLMALRECGLKNDALMDSFYEIVMESFEGGGEYAILVYHDRYDIPAKAKDKERLWESEEMFEYLICAVCPLEGEYEPGKPVWGFLFPAFSDRSGDLYRVNVFEQGRTQKKLLEQLLGAEQ